MKLIIAGSRDIENPLYIDSNMKIITSKYGIPNEIIHGGAKGPDTHGKKWAERKNIKTNKFVPKWNEYGRSAGPIRNSEMAQYGDVLLAIWDGESSGTKDMIEKALDSGIDIHVVNINR